MRAGGGSRCRACNGVCWNTLELGVKCYKCVTAKVDMNKVEYVFDDVNAQREWLRLHAIEQVYDPFSQTRLKSAGVKTGARCLEIGAGAGSIARWMASVSGPTGHVSAVDINPRFLKNEKNYFELIQGDILEVILPEKDYDVIHARYVLIHIREYRKALDKIVQWLRPGGWVVLEEPDFLTAKPVNGTSEEINSIRRVNKAIESMYASKGTHPGFGSTLPPLLDDIGFQETAVDMDVPLIRGGTGVSEVMAQSAEQLSEQYLATHEASKDDIRNYVEYCRNPKRWAVYYATVAACSRKPKE